MCNCKHPDGEDVLRAVCIADENGNVSQYLQCSMCGAYFEENVIRIDGHSPVERREKLTEWKEDHGIYKISRINSLMEFRYNREKPWHYMEIGFVDPTAPLKKIS